MDLTPFELVFEMGTPMIIGKHPIHLDGLLSHLCFKHTGCPLKALNMLPDLLKWNDTHKVYHASAMAFGVTYEQGIVATTRNYAGVMRTGVQLRSDIVAPSTVTQAGVKKYRKVIIAGGPEKNRLDKMPAYHAPYALFHGVGDIKKIEPLIRYHCSRLGAKANSGAGTIQGFSIQPVDNDYSWFDQDGQVARALPISLSGAAKGELMPVYPPYWKEHCHYVEVPATPAIRVRRLLVNK